MQGVARQHTHSNYVAVETWSLHLSHPRCPSSRVLPGAVGSLFIGARGPVPTMSISWSGTGTDSVLHVFNGGTY